MTTAPLLPHDSMQYMPLSLPNKKRGEIKPTEKISSAWLEDMLEYCADGITVQDEKGTLLYINKKAAQMSGISDVRQFLHTDGQGIVNKFELYDEFQNPFPLEALPGRRVINGENFAEEVVCFRRLDGGEEHWALVRSVPWIDKANKRCIINTFFDITEYKKNENERATQLGIVSHEVKSLLTSVKAYGQLLERKLQKTADITNIQYVQKMDLQLNKLTQFITDLMDTSRIKARKLSMHKELLDFNELTKEMVDDMRVAYPDHTFTMAGLAKKEIYADKSRITQVLLNLLTNAVKYSPEGGRITVTIQEDGYELTCSIADQGIGIAPEYAKKIFNLFYQVPDPKKETKKGLGIGLYITDGIIKTHGGKITVKSTIGKGTTFSFTLPFPKETHA